MSSYLSSVNTGITLPPQVDSERDRFMNNVFIKSVFGPIDNIDYCLFYFVIEFITFALAILTLLGGVFSFFLSGFNLFIIPGVLMTFILYFITYINARILYSMCNNSIKKM